MTLSTKIHLLGVVVLILLLNLTACTRVTFYVDEEVDQPLDFVEISAVIKADGESLDATIEDAGSTIKSIEELVDTYCKGYTAKDKQKEECQDIVDASPYSIKPQY